MLTASGWALHSVQTLLMEIVEHRTEHQQAAIITQQMKNKVPSDNLRHMGDLGNLPQMHREPFQLILLTLI